MYKLRDTTLPQISLLPAHASRLRVGVPAVPAVRTLWRPRRKPRIRGCRNAGLRRDGRAGGFAAAVSRTLPVRYGSAQAVDNSGQPAVNACSVGERINCAQRVNIRANQGGCAVYVPKFLSPLTVPR